MYHSSHEFNHKITSNKKNQIIYWARKRKIDTYLRKQTKKKIKKINVYSEHIRNSKVSSNLHKTYNQSQFIQRWFELKRSVTATHSLWNSETFPFIFPAIYKLQFINAYFHRSYFRPIHAAMIYRKFSS